MDSPGVAIDAANIGDIVEGLAVPRGGVRVPRPIHLPLATYIVKTLGSESLDEFIAMGAEGAAATLSALEEDLAGAEKPHYGNHGNRRHSDKVARDTMDLTGTSEGDIDDFFGWDQRQRQKKSQLHYHGRIDRQKRARVTMML